MNKSTVVVVSSIVLLAGGAAGYWYWQNQQPDIDYAQIEAPIQKSVPAAPVEEAAPAFPLKLDIPPQPAQPPLPPLPALEQSDSFVLETLNTLLSDPALVKIFISDKLIEKFVASIDNLPSKSLPVKVMPIKTTGGSMITTGSESDLTISPKNAERYVPYIKVLNAADTKQLVQLYIRLYPLLQLAYEDLGYPDKYFNDRLIEVIDHLLDAPDVTGPVKLVQPKVVYKFADPELETRSIGQRIMIRIGSQN
ncbi:MAG TPA: DUF3014 domain-containing protein, partial [Gammaproteobacteria bacterium]